MSYFDESSPVFARNPSPAMTYHSYMCPSRAQYLNKSVGTETSADQTRITQDKRLQQNISKLRDVLSETISNLTRGSNLKKGESVELTLEIELMKSIENSPANSLVEVTIIQHNNKDGSKNTFTKIPNKMLFKIEQDEPPTRESLSQKQTWFKRVISRENTMSRHSTNLRDRVNKQQGDGIQRKHIHKPLFCSTANRRFNELNNPETPDGKTNFINTFPADRANFINILPEETSKKKNVSKSDKKTLKRERKRESAEDTNKSQEQSKNPIKKTTLMGKISDIFLPSKKPSKKDVVSTALLALKDEIDNMKTAPERENYKHNKKPDKAPAQNLGKLVNTILFNVMESMDSDDKNTLKNELSLPLEYQSFFEPVTKASKKHKERKLIKRNKSLSINKMYRSHSDTCCVRPLKNKMEPTLQTQSSNSVSDCRVHVETKAPPTKTVGDTNHIHKKRRERSKKRNMQRDHSRGHKKIMKGNKRIVPNTAEEDYTKSNLPNQKALLSSSSLIQWNGRCVKVSKDIKARIEMLIVNELENLALKEGMECDITPLSSTDNTVETCHTVEKMSSFICELDISDKNVRKMIKRKKSLHTKVSVHSPSEMFKVEKYPTNKARTNTTITTGGQKTLQVQRDSSNNVNDNLIVKREVCINTTNNDINSTTAQTSDDQNSVEIKYMNKNMQNWSAESQTVTFYSTEMIKSKQKTSDRVGENNKKTGMRNRFMSTGFVKVINSDDSAWNKCHPQVDLRNNCLAPVRDTSGRISAAAAQSSSETSNELGRSIEIELDIQDLEFILHEARHRFNADKVLIEAKCVNPPRKQPKSFKPIGKNSPSYTNQLLVNAVKKLEKYSKTKSNSNVKRLKK